MRTKEQRNKWCRTRVCKVCGKEESVRKDNIAESCRKCASSVSLEKAHNAIRQRPKLKTTCQHCSKEFNTCKSTIAKGQDRFCSKPCFLAAHRVSRTCKQCHNDFVIGRSRVYGTSNSSGNYCSRPCYEESLCKDDEGQYRGSRWRRISNEVKNRIPFCVSCTGKRNLEIHHIVPYRHTADNSKSNLITVCKRCHYKVEKITRSLVKSGVDFDQMKLVLRSIFLERLMVVAYQLKTRADNG